MTKIHEVIFELCGGVDFAVLESLMWHVVFHCYEKAELSWTSEAIGEH